MTSKKIYCNSKGKQVVAHDKFIYCSSVYLLWKNGASLLEEKYYASNKPVKLKKNDNLLKNKTYKLVRFFELEFAPEIWLERQGYKLIEL